MGSGPHGLNERQRRFADGLLKGKPASKAYIDAGYSPKAAEANASRLKGNDKVQAYLDEKRTKIEERTVLTAEKVVEELGQQAFFTISDLYGALEEGGGIEGPEDLARLPDDVQRLVKGWKWDQHGNFVVELVDRQWALDRLGKVFGIYQGDRLNDRDRQAALATQVLWRFVMAMHVSRGVPFADAWSYAENNPDEVQGWGREVGLLPAGEPADDDQTSEEGA